MPMYPNLNVLEKVLARLGDALIDWLAIAPELLLVLLVVVLVHRIGTPMLLRLTTRLPLPYSHRIVKYGNKAGRAALLFLLLQIVLRNEVDGLPGIAVVRHLAGLGVIAALTVLAIRCVRAVADTILASHPPNVANNLEARRIHTQTRVLAGSATVLLILIGSGLALMTLPFLREIGASLLASAGAAGLVVGFAAKPVLGNLLAGLQLALTQPLRLEDVVIVENEWGWIEEITGTYVVVRLWDQRRLIVPLQWFIEHPFQNWTRNSSEILGVVLIWVDYRMPMAPLRAEAERLCKAAPEWDGRLCLLQVVDTSERALQVRVLVSAADAPASWDLRCRVREGLVAFVATHYADYLPQLRADVHGADAPPAPLPATATPPA